MSNNYQKETIESNLKCGFPPVLNTGAKLLILGSMPGDASINQCQYYAHPRNAFWPIMGEILNFDPDLPYSERLEFLCRNNIALWDVLKSCVRPGSLDSNISRPEANDVHSLLLSNPEINTICCNGTAAFRFFNKHNLGVADSGISVFKMPSTSPASARLSFQEKLEAYRKIVEKVIFQ